MARKTWNTVTLHYALITGGFWMCFCVSVSFAAVYLQGVGFSNSELGIILALGNVGGAVLGPALGAWIDRNRKLRHAALINVLLVAQAVLLVLLFLHPRKDLVTAACYILYTTAALPVNALNLDLDVRLERAGAPVNFGPARSMGSLAFVLLSLPLGIVTERLGHLALPCAGMAVVLLQLAGNRLIDRDLRQAEGDGGGYAAQITEKSASLMAFVRENGRFCLMLFGTIFIYIAHNMDGNYLINEIRFLGGDTAILGYVSAFTAIAEIPVMLYASRLPKKWETVHYIRLSFVFFVIRHLAYALAPTLAFFFAARILQGPSYALYTVLIVGYAGSRVAAKDSAKAQSLAFSMTTVGSVLASLIGGVMMDTLGVRPTMLAGAAICLLGAVIAIAGTVDGKKKA